MNILWSKGYPFDFCGAFAILQYSRIIVIDFYHYIFITSCAICQQFFVDLAFLPIFSAALIFNNERKRRFSFILCCFRAVCRNAGKKFVIISNIHASSLTILSLAILLTVC